jgi:outer membrane protein assembly factor BamB
MRTRAGEEAMKRTRIAAVAVAALLAPAVLSVISCGSHGGGGGTGQLRVTVKWPKASRLIPKASNSINTAVLDNGTQRDHKLLAKPAAGATQTSVTYTDLAPGGYSLTATAFPNADGTGVAQATGSVAAPITAGQTTNVTLTMDSTIVRVDVTPANPTVIVGGSQQLTATCFDQNDSVVLVAAGNISWQTADQTKVTVNAATGLATGVAAAPNGVNVTATESESTKSGSTKVTVTPQQAGCTASPNPGSGVEGGSVWPRFGGTFNANHSQGPAGVNSPSGAINWTAQTSAGVSSIPIFGPSVGGGEGTLYVGAIVDHKLTALNGATGAQLWQSPNLNGSPFSSPALGKNGLVYLSTQNNDGFHAINASSGAVSWSITTADVTELRSPGAPAIAGDGTVYLPVVNTAIRGNVSLLALNGTTHAVKWKFAADPPLGGFGAGNGGAPAISVATGAVYFSAQDGNVYGIEPGCGTSNWKFTPPNGSGNVSQPVLSANETLLYVHAGSKIYAIEAIDGHLAWQADVAGGGLNVPAVTSSGLVIAVGGFGQVFAFNGTTGAQQWSFTPVGQANAGAIGIAVDRSENGDEVIYTATGSQQRLFAIDASNGSSLWEFNPPMASVISSSSPIIGVTGHIFVRTLDGVVYSIK